jgi:glutathione peroxidase
MTAATNIYDVPLTSIAAEPLDQGLLRGHVSLIVNVASRCGLTPQYDGLQSLYERYRERGLVVLGVPCNQFGDQEPGTPEEIVEFCSTSYSVTFPLTEKLDVNGPDRHPLYELLTAAPDQAGEAGDVQWNFEKFVVSPRGEVVARFRPTTPPDAAELVEAIEKNLGIIRSSRAPARRPPRA